VTPVQAFYSANEARKPQANRVYHNNSACPAGHGIPPSERRSGTNDYHQCAECANQTRHPNSSEMASP
jgi:hypothetical protein